MQKLLNFKKIIFYEIIFFAVGTNKFLGKHLRFTIIHGKNWKDLKLNLDRNDQWSEETFGFNLVVFHLVL